jgi:hypothetical protein
MLDVLFCCTIIIANVRQAGYFALAADIVKRMAARCRTPRTQRLVQDDWTSRLARLESYVTAMA